MRCSESRLPSHVLSLVALCAVLVLATAAGCGGGPSEESVEERLEETGTMDVIERAAEARYDPPADGRLTEQQMEMYLEVQERAIEIRRVAKKRMEDRVGQGEGGAQGDQQPNLFEALRAVGDLGDVMTAELRAAQELGHNPAEYQWVQGQILEAQMSRAGKEMQRGAAQAGRQFLEMLEAQLENAESPEQRDELRRQIREYEENLAQVETDEELEPSVQHNLELFQEHQERIREVQEQAAGQME